MKNDLAFYLTMLIAALLVSGCAPKMRIMAPESMLEVNRMERLALLGEGGVRWMGAGHKPDIEVSRKSLEFLLGAIEQELGFKGYEMAFSRPTRIVFGMEKEDFRAHRFIAKGAHVRLTNEMLGKEGWYTVFEDYLGDREKKLSIRLDKPAYQYPFKEEESALGKAAARVLERSGCLSGTETGQEACAGIREDMLAIRNSTGADTICIVDVSGLNQTAGSKALMGAMSFITILALTPVPPPPDQTTVSLMCVDAISGDMLWWHVLAYPVAASNPRAKDAIARSFLQFVPDAGNPLEAKCRIVMKQGDCRTLYGEAAKECKSDFPSAPVWECGLRQFYPEPGSIVEERQAAPAEPPKEDLEAEARPAKKKRIAGRYWYIGMGSNSTKLTTDQPAFKSISGTGFHLTGGMIFGRFSFGAGMSAFDFTSQAPTEDVFYPVDDASYSYFSFDMKFDLLNIDASKWTPWVALEWTLQDYGLSNYVYSKMGSCFKPALGVDVRVAKWLLLRAGWRECSFVASGSYPTGSGKTNVENITLDIVFRIRSY